MLITYLEDTKLGVRNEKLTYGMIEIVVIIIRNFVLKPS